MLLFGALVASLSAALTALPNSWSADLSMVSPLASAVLRFLSTCPSLLNLLNGVAWSVHSSGPSHGVYVVPKIKQHKLLTLSPDLDHVLHQLRLQFRGRPSSLEDPMGPSDAPRHRLGSGSIPTSRKSALACEERPLGRVPHSAGLSSRKGRPPGAFCAGGACGHQGDVRVRVSER